MVDSSETTKGEFKQPEILEEKQPPTIQEHMPFECSICRTDFDDNNVKPMVLGCGHSMCSTCIE